MCLTRSEVGPKKPNGQSGLDAAKDDDFGARWIIQNQRNQSTHCCANKGKSNHCVSNRFREPNRRQSCDDEKSSNRRAHFTEAHCACCGRKVQSSSGIAWRHKSKQAKANCQDGRENIDNVDHRGRSKGNSPWGKRPSVSRHAKKDQDGPPRRASSSAKIPSWAGMTCLLTFRRRFPKSSLLVCSGSSGFCSGSARGKDAFCQRLRFCLERGETR